MKEVQILPGIKLLLEFESPDSTSKIHLEYELFDNGFSIRWLRLLEEAISKGYDIQEGGVFLGADIDSMEEIVENMTRVVNSINAFIDEKGFDDEYRIKLKPHPDMDRPFLNRMHQYFEDLRPNPLFQTPNAPRHIETDLAELNTLVHRGEGIIEQGDEFRGCIVEVNFSHVDYGEFEDDDWFLFTPDKVFGNLNLTYGVTGVPVEAAYYARPVNPPVPQPNYCSGFQLSFVRDTKFEQWDDMAKWLDETYGWDIEDPKLAIGYIPLGRILTPYSSQEELVAMIGDHKKLTDIQVIKDDSLKPAIAEQSLLISDNGEFTILDKDGKAASSSLNLLDSFLESLNTKNPKFKLKLERNLQVNFPDACWPAADQEIRYHLIYKPYIHLNKRFFAEPLYNEALAVLEEFVEHRAYATGGEDGAAWKSLALNAIEGDPSKTSYHTHYGIEGKAEYQLTPVADKCPKTMEFLRKITDISQCERIRFMLLEPGATIDVHKDSDDDVCSAVNISLNMPKGCKFYSEVNADGSHNDYTVEVPFKNTGSIVLFNNARYHRVENLSDQPRIHIILHGPLRVDLDELRETARNQNELYNVQDLTEAVIKKKVDLKEGILGDSDLFRDWKTAGMKHGILPEQIKILLVDDPIDDNKELSDKCLHQISASSLFPIPHTIVDVAHLDAALAELPASTTHSVIIFAGTLIKETNALVVELISAIMDLENKNAVLAGHIIHESKDDEALPYLHEQFTILNMSAWRMLERPAFGIPYGGASCDFPSYQRSEANVHDDYTPLFLELGDAIPARTGRSWYGTELMAEALRKGFSVINISEQLRNNKMYAYPKGDEGWQMEQVEEEIAARLDYLRDNVFYFNNEPLQILTLNAFKPSKLLSVASGFKPVAIHRQIWGEDGADAVHFLDYSKAAISYWQGLVNTDDETELFFFIRDFMQQHGKGIQLPDNGIRDQLRSVIEQSFDNDISLLMQHLHKLRNASFSELDFISDHSSLFQQIDKSDSVLFWHSNAWDCNGIRYRMNSSEISENYLNLGKEAAAFWDSKVFKNKNTFEMIIGDDLHSPRSFFTDGSFHKFGFIAEDWIEID